MILPCSIASPQVYLATIRALLKEPAHWTKGAIWRTHKGKKPHRQPPYAFCLAGAFYWLEPAATSRRVVQKSLCLLKRSVLETHGHPNIASFNDAPETTHADVLEVLNYAIGKAIINPQGTK